MVKSISPSISQLVFAGKYWFISKCCLSLWDYQPVDHLCIASFTLINYLCFCVIRNLLVCCLCGELNKYISFHHSLQIASDVRHNLLSFFMVILVLLLTTRVLCKWLHCLMQAVVITDDLLKMIRKYNIMCNELVGLKSRLKIFRKCLYSYDSDHIAFCGTEFILLY